MRVASQRIEVKNENKLKKGKKECIKMDILASLIRKRMEN